MHPDDKVHGEIALIIRSSIKHYEIDKHQIFCRPQSSSIMIEANKGNACITISAVYSSLKHIIKIEQYITFRETLRNHFIAAGDYNAKHTQ